MIFPELPKRYNLTLKPPSVQTIGPCTAKAPLHSPEEPRVEHKITVEEWYVKHGLATDPAAGKYTPRTKEQIDWLAKDAWEFYALCTAMTVWIVYWLGIHRSWW